MGLDHSAIRKAYPNVMVTDDSGLILDAAGNQVAVEQSKIDAARVELNKLKYKTDRTQDGTVTYGTWREQLSMLYDDIVAGKLDSTGSFFAHNKAVKDANPKP
tara:strand:+ start:135 stop:443 length:309 start_codon:yes stop_codon:yes gene_type:complete